MSNCPTFSKISCDRASTLLPLALWNQVQKARQQPNHFLELCLTDPAGSPLRQSRVHIELQNFLTNHAKALIELPRDHGKSVQVCGRLIWELGHNPALRIKLVCSTDALAAERTRFLREAIESNPRVKLVFPELEPAEPWAADAFTIRRPAAVIGPSVAAFGIGSGSTGARADLLVCDDVVDVRALVSQAERDRVSGFFHNNLLNLLEPDGRFWGLFTPWHGDDLNARLKASGTFPHFRRAVGPDLEPVWPEKWTRERLQQRLDEIGASAFARGYRLTVLDEQQILIPASWVRTWSDELPRERYESLLLSVDPAVSLATTADESAIVVLGRTGNEIRVLEASARRLTVPDLVDRLDVAAQYWQPDVILFEANAGFSGIKDLLIRHARFGPRIRGVTQSRSKAARVGAFAVPVQNGCVRLKGTVAGTIDPAQAALFEQMTTFPFSARDDLLDAAATGCEYLLSRPEPRAW